MQAVLDRQVTQHAGVDLAAVDATPSRGHSTVVDKTHFRCRQLQGKRRRDSVVCTECYFDTVGLLVSYQPSEKERKGKEEYLYSAFSHQGTYKVLRHGSHSFTCKQHHACLSLHVGVNVIILTPITNG